MSLIIGFPKFSHVFHEADEKMDIQVQYHTFCKTRS
jgi:hypothetical protein